MRSYLLLLACFVSSVVYGQELKCSVTVNADQVQFSNKRIFKTLETTLSEFVNNRSWTNDKFQPSERIDCAILITITSYSPPDQFAGNIQITANRPVYGSGYSSSVFNHKDLDFSFAYLENAPLEFTPDQFRSNLSSVVAYYIYIILGLDYDSFSPQGGTPYFNEAQRIVSNAQNTSFTGWMGSEKPRNRFWLVDNVLQTSFQPLREAMYLYHRQGLDLLVQNPTEGRANILRALELLKKVHAVQPLSFNMQLFFTAKQQELIGLFSAATPAEKEQVMAILKILDPANLTRYADINKSR
ncbi:MAG TPA: DUF4835 family protein [Luteibaculaceae bacterium]|nr:DUF4835 family protein [Luteibaculaceae bacterium]